MQSDLNFINIAMVFPEQLDFTISEIRRQNREVGLEKFALSLSFHPTGTPAGKHADKLVEAFSKVKEGLQDVPAIRLGVLLQSTLGHNWSGPVPLTGEKWQRTVTADGAVSSRMCPCDAGFRQYILECIEKIMQRKPEFLLLDDDFGLKKNECFCPLHLAQFSQMTGRNWSREELVTMLKECPENEYAQLFSRMRGELAVNFAREIRKVIDCYDKNITCTYCTPAGGHGFAHDVAVALAGECANASARVDNAIYGANNQNAFFFLTTKTHRVINLYENVHDCIDEADTFPHNYYSENAEMFNAHLVNALLCGLSGAKLWMFEYDQANVYGSQARYEEIFRQNLPLYKELYKTLDGIRWLGVKSVMANTKGMLHPLNVSLRLYAPDWNSAVLGPLAIPIAYGRANDGGICALNGDIAEQLDDEEVLALLSGKVLLDSLAVKNLAKRGFSEYMGVTLGNSQDFFYESEYMDGMSMPFWSMWDESAAELKCIGKDCIVSSWFMRKKLESNEPEKVSPSMTFARNRLGGRVVALGWSSTMAYFTVLNNPRRQIIYKALDFLNEGTFEMCLETRHQAIVRNGILADGKEFLSIISLAQDQESSIPLRCTRKPVAVQCLAEDGTWGNVPFSFDQNTLLVKHPLMICKPVILRITR